MFRLCLLFALLLPACSFLGDSDESKERGALVLASGTSFGECLGYCRTDLVLEQDDAQTRAQITWLGWGDGLPPVSASRLLTNAEATAIGQAFDRARLLAAAEVYGCPDCADGGAEYVELREDTVVKRVTFEAGDEVAGLGALIREMRALRASFEGDRPGML